MKWIKLTDARSGKDMWMNIAMFIEMLRSEERGLVGGATHCTRLFGRGGYTYVLESPEEIARLAHAELID